MSYYLKVLILALVSMGLCIAAVISAYATPHTGFPMETALVAFLMACCGIALLMLAPFLAE